MLHRLTLRVLPSLTLAVTEPEVRKRKRLVMLVPGLVAFVIYRVLEAVRPITEASTLLVVSGLIGAVTALWAYRVGRQASLGQIWHEDGARRLAWLVGWVGIVYGVQLSLLVLALCFLVTYDFRLHPSGPAMMALIIASTSVARDAFEIAHVRRLQHDGRPVLTFPDGASFRGLLHDRPANILRWFVVGGALCSAVAWAVETAGQGRLHEILHLSLVTVLAGSLALAAFLDGQQPGGSLSRFHQVGGAELLRFWVWPGLWFAATYDLVLLSAFVFVLGFDPVSGAGRAFIGGLVGGLLPAYCYYLGVRRALEDRLQQTLPDSLLRCPFVMGILSKNKGGTAAATADAGVSASAVLYGQPGREQ